MQIKCDFPGGNIKLIDIEDNEVIVAPDLRDTAGHWFWWYFSVTGAPDADVNFVFSSPGAIGTNGVAVSRDGGRTWEWYSDVSRGTGWIPDAFMYRAPVNVEDVRFAFAIPYLKGNWDAFLAKHGASPLLVERKLCSSTKGRPVYYYLLGNQGKAPVHRILLTARHHACESPPNFVLEGIIEEVLLSEWFQDNVQVLIIPFMDVDGVEDGDQGKNRKPWDHNRDYGAEPIYPEVKAVKELVPHWAHGGLSISLDLHAPGRTDDFFHMVGQEDPRQWKELARFSSIVSAACTRLDSTLRVDPARNVPWGTGWNKAGTTGVERSHASWIGTLGIARLYTTLEIPYGSVLDVPVTPGSLREFGNVLVEAFKEYMAGNEQGI